MGLLPLAAIWTGRIGEREMLSAETIRTQAILRDSDMDRAHFARVLASQDWAALLETAINEQSSLFAFSYR